MLLDVAPDDETHAYAVGAMSYLWVDHRAQPLRPRTRAFVVERADADACRLPGMLHGAGRVLDRKLVTRFDYCVREVIGRLPQISRVLAGEAPAWLADCPAVAVVRERIGAPDASAAGSV